MFYPESVDLLAELPTKEVEIRDLDRFLHEHGGELVSLHVAAFLLDVPARSLKKLLTRYVINSVLTKEFVFKCPVCDDERLEPDRSCSVCGGKFPRSTTLNQEECFRIKTSASPKLTAKKEKRMIIEERIIHGRIRPWVTLQEEDYLLNLTTLGAAEQNWILERIQMQGFCLLRWQGMTPTHHQLRAIEEFLGPACESQNGLVGKVKEINPSEAFEANTGDSSKTLAFHSDGTQNSPLPPAILVFQYLTTPTLGGLSTFIDLSQIILGMSDDEQFFILSELAYSDTALCEKKGLRYEGPLVKPVCAEQSLSFRLRFDDKIKVAGRSQQAFNLLKQKIFAQSKFLKYPPHEGDIAIFDNWRVLHGRNSIEGSRHLRFHNRVWLSDLDDRHRGNCLLGVRGLSTALISKIMENNEK